MLDGHQAAFVAALGGWYPATVLTAQHLIMSPEEANPFNSPEAQEELYRLLGGEPDPERQREALAREVARLRLKWRPGS